MKHFVGNTIVAHVFISSTIVEQVKLNPLCGIYEPDDMTGELHEQCL